MTKVLSRGQYQMAGQGWTVKQAAKALGQSEKTIRRRIKSGEIRAEQVPGKYGMEYRVMDINTTLPLDRGVDMTRGDTMVKALDVTRDEALVNALDMVRALQVENERLAAQVGFLQAQLQEAQNKVRLLAAPRSPWWQRLLWWRKG